MDTLANRNVAKVARKYNFSYQRVYNWLKRGVPYRVRVEHPDVMKELVQKNKRDIWPELENK